MNAHTHLNPRQKAAIIVRLLLDDEDLTGLSNLPTDLQTNLAQAMAGLEIVDRSTRDAVIGEFCDALESVGLTFPGNLDGTLAMLGGKLSEDSTDRLRRLAAVSGNGDPWARIAALPQDQQMTLARGESVELIALMLSKLPVERASAIFTALPRDRARAVAQAMSMTSGINRDALRRMGLVLLHAADCIPRPAISTPATDRVGAILNFATSDLRDDVLQALDSQDPDFAEEVRKAIFIFAHIPEKIEPRDIPRVVREVDQAVLLRALSASTGDDAAAAEFILSNLSQRMADNLREERDALGKLRNRDIEEAMTEVVSAIRRLIDAGELQLIVPQDGDDGDA